MKTLNNYLFQKRAQQYLSKTSRERRFINYDKAKSVLLLFESDLLENNQNVRKIIAQLQQDGKKVSAWGFIDKKEVSTSILPEFRILHRKHTDFFQRPVMSFVNELENQEFDLLIDLSIKPVVALEYIAMYANASCKTGLRKTNLPLFDFMLDLESLKIPAESTESNEKTVDEIYLFEQIIFYLKSIQTKD